MNAGTMKTRLAPFLYAGNRIHALMDRLGEQRALDGPAQTLERATGVIPSHGPVKDALSGTWLDHPLHPMLTDLPIGFWTSAWVLDIVGSERDRDAARRLVGAGVLCAVPAALAGAADWSDTEGASRRVGVVHAVVNSSALALYAGSWIARRRGRHARGVALSWAGATFATVGGFLGGHLVAALGVGVDHTTFDESIDEWTAVGELDTLSDQLTRVEVLGTPILLHRSGDEIQAIAATCPHRGAPLDEGTVDEGTNEGDVVTCPWHGSRFCLRDGSLLEGPSPTGVVSYETRVRAGTVEIRSRH
jgi:nitrite reductase/ring-hydroxylating ferredoxin subunit/uncharacterized membrane protein